MTTEKAASHIRKAREILREARDLLHMEHAEAAGRQTYIAAFHAALAFIALRTGKEPKTHSGARSEFARLAKNDPLVDRSYTTFLAEAYKLKSVADYDVEFFDTVSLDEAEEAVTVATRFVDLIAGFLEKKKSRA